MDVFKSIKVGDVVWLSVSMLANQPMFKINEPVKLNNCRQIKDVVFYLTVSSDIK